MGRNLVIAIYSHPEYYPPTLNAIDQLAPYYDQIIILHRNITGFDWEYPPNVHLVGPRKLKPVREVEKAGFITKIFWFLQFCRMFIGLNRKYRPQALILYDCIPVLAYRITRLFLVKPAILWYHNHDVADGKYIRKYSINWFAWRSESWIFPRLDIFSLPSKERMEFFPMKTLGGTFVFLPNFPSLKRYTTEFSKASDVIRILYQGSIGPLHGLEQLITLLRKRYNDLPVKLVLKGFVSDEYLAELKSIAALYEVQNHIDYLPPSGYKEVIRNAQNCHIGIGIFMKQDIMNKTLGTASNKLYEYAAAGLPVLVYDIEHFRKELGGLKWILFVDSSQESMNNCISRIVENYEELSLSAINDFKDQFNFEVYFKNVLSILNN